MQLATSTIRPNPNQPRKIFDEAKLAELAASIEAEGLIQPITVRPDPTLTTAYTIVCGERRFRASQLLGLDVIEANVVEMTEEEMEIRAIVENLQRADITPLEEAAAFQRQIDAGMTVDELAERLGTHRRRVADKLLLLQLTDEMQEAFRCGIINTTQAWELLTLDAHSQRVLFKAIASGKCKTVSQLKATAEALRHANDQASMFADDRPTKADQRTARRLLDSIEKVAAVLAKGFDDNEIVITRKVSPLEADVAAEKLELIEAECRKLRHALRAAAVVQSAAQGDLLS